MRYVPGIRGDRFEPNVSLFSMKKKQKTLLAKSVYFVTKSISRPLVLLSYLSSCLLINNHCLTSILGKGCIINYHQGGY